MSSAKETLNKEDLTWMGNFGFLLKFDEDFLFELGVNAESCLYTNRRMCAVHIRQLMEAFLNSVADKFEISLSDASEGMDVKLKDIQIKITDYFSTYHDDYYVNNVFPRFPGVVSTSPGLWRTSDRVKCPAGEGTDTQGNALVDSKNPTLFVWNMIRKIGNAGAHPNPQNPDWLKEEYLTIALKELRNRISRYYHHLNRKPVPDLETTPLKRCYGTGQVVFSDTAKREFTKSGILPKYTEEVCVSSALLMRNSNYQYERGRYAIVRLFEKEDDVPMKFFLLQSQRAYMIIQNNGGIPGIPEFSVLADLRMAQDTYVTAYMFNSKPRPLNWKSLDEAGVYNSVESLRKLFADTMIILQRLCDMRIYHRTFTHESIRLEIHPKIGCSAKEKACSVSVIGLETCKLFEDSGGRTVLPYAEEQITDKHRPDYDNLKQYNGKAWNAGTSETEYRREVFRRAGCVFLNVLAPEHLKRSFIGDRPAQREEILSSGNDIWDRITDENAEREKVARLIEELENLRDGKWTDAQLLSAWASDERQEETQDAGCHE